MKSNTTGSDDGSESALHKALHAAILEVDPADHDSLPVAILFFERDGTLSSMIPPLKNDLVDDTITSMVAMEFVYYAFEREDWMKEFCLSLEFQKSKHSENKVKEKRSKFTLIKGGKEDEEG
jgi:hypothetical protein